MPDWTLVSSGIEYRQFTLPDPNNVFVARMDRGNLNASIESCIAQGRLVSGKETVSGMAARYDQTINYWGQTWGPRNKMVVAINGDFHDPTTGLPTSGQIHSGWYAKRFRNLESGSGFAWKLDRSAFVGQCVHHRNDKQLITFTATWAPPLRIIVRWSILSPTAGGLPACWWTKPAAKTCGILSDSIR